jgi:DNA-binding MarR family transcriptional regulator
MTAHNNGLTTERLLEISDEVSRIASTLARLSTDRGPVASAFLDNSPPPMVSTKAVRSVIRARRLRERFFDEALFADPAWDMMLDLFESELSGRRVAVSSLCAGAAVPATTALRWIKTLVEKGLFVRRNDPLDGRRVFIELSPAASLALKRYFGELANAANI